MIQNNLQRTKTKKNINCKRHLPEQQKSKFIEKNNNEKPSFCSLGHRGSTKNKSHIK